MPNKDGTGPDGNNANSGAGRGSGRGQGQGRGQGHGQGQGRGLGRNRKIGSALSDSSCVCPSCGQKTQHKAGQPCYEQKCPKCETKMTLE